MTALILLGIPMPKASIPCFNSLTVRLSHSYTRCPRRPTDALHLWEPRADQYSRWVQTYCDFMRARCSLSCVIKQLPHSVAACITCIQRESSWEGVSQIIKCSTGDSSCSSNANHMLSDLFRNNDSPWGWMHCSDYFQDFQTYIHYLKWWLNFE